MWRITKRSGNVLSDLQQASKDVQAILSRAFNTPGPLYKLQRLEDHSIVQTKGRFAMEVSRTLQQVLDTLDALEPQSIDEVGENPRLKELAALIGAQGVIDEDFRREVVMQADLLSLSQERSDRIKAFVLIVPFQGMEPMAKHILDALAINSADIMKPKKRPGWRFW